MGKVSMKFGQDCRLSCSVKKIIANAKHALTRFLNSFSVTLVEEGSNVVALLTNSHSHSWNMCISFLAFDAKKYEKCLFCETSFHKKDKVSYFKSNGWHNCWNYHPVSRSRTTDNWTDQWCLIQDQWEEQCMFKERRKCRKNTHSGIRAKNAQKKSMGEILP